MIAGAGLFLVGLLIVVGGRFAWFGNLPGDIVIKRENLTVFAPIGTHDLAQHICLQLS
jgi:hypothetical protein